MNQLELEVRASDAPVASEGGREVLPLIDGRDLIALVGEFERMRGFDLPGSYGGLLIGWFLGASTLVEYFMGRERSRLRGSGTIAVLGCSCGDTECGPLYATVEARRRRVTWSRFRQPYRPAQDYGNFGFEFDRSSYEDALEAAVSRIKSGS